MKMSQNIGQPKIDDNSNYLKNADAPKMKTNSKMNTTQTLKIPQKMKTSPIL